MVMMENFQEKSVAFLPKGKIAIGIKPTQDSIEIVQKAKKLGYILFHHRSNEDQHLFRIIDECEFINKEGLEDIYQNVKTTQMYLVVEFDSNTELDSSAIFSSNIRFTPRTRYDAQFALISELTVKS